MTGVQTCALPIFRRERDPDDRRALQVTLTDEGVELLRRMWPVYEQGIERHFAAHLEGGMKQTLAKINRA